MTATKIRQSEFAAQHKLKAPEVAALRREHLKEGVDFWSEGRAIYWTEEAAKRVDNIIRGIIVPVETDFGTVTFIPHGLGSCDDETNITPDLEMNPVEYVESEILTVRTTRPCRSKGCVDHHRKSRNSGNTCRCQRARCCIRELERPNPAAGMRKSGIRRVVLVLAISLENNL